VSGRMSQKIQVTKNYRMFGRSSENRPFDLRKHKRLSESMKLYGFLREFPIVAIRDAKGNLIVKDGQHRLAIAESLGLPVYWIEASKDWDVAVVNSTAKPWLIRDYAEKHAANGLSAYRDGLEFADQHHIPVGVAFAMLAGTTSFGNIESQFVDGTFKVKDRKWAEAVASLYGPLVLLSQAVRHSNFLAACMAVCRVAEFDTKRMLANAERCRERLVSYSTREAYLEMLEEIYNFGRHGPRLVGLKVEAMKVMRERNATVKAKAEKVSRNGKATHREKVTA
jgi:hypothetical protein